MTPVACDEVTSHMFVSAAAGEIGIRMALEAHRSTVIRLILRQVLALLSLGLVLGLVAALTASRLIRSFLSGVEATVR